MQKLKCLGILIPFCALLSACAATPQIQRGANAESIDGGLHKVDNSLADVAYADPNVDFSQYDKFVLLPLFLENVSIVQPELSRKERATWILTEEDKSLLRDLYAQEMKKALQSDNGYTIVEETPVAGTLMIMSAIVAIHPNAPRGMQSEGSARGKRASACRSRTQAVRRASARSPPESRARDNPGSGEGSGWPPRTSATTHTSNSS